jgi:hypothetical protein
LICPIPLFFLRLMHSMATLHSPSATIQKATVKTVLFTPFTGIAIEFVLGIEELESRSCYSGY